ncbi:MAG: porin [Acidobacteriota bacterium]|nr:porin [Acidobacteriota bacterium]
MPLHAQDAPPQDPPASTNVAAESFFKRLSQAYLTDWKGASTASGASTSPPNANAAPAFRGYPAPVDGPPFPFAVWPYGGSVVIGQPWTQAAPLMTALWNGPHGDAWKRSRVQIYGWLNFGGNVSNSSQGGYSNFPAAYAERANTVQPDQEVLYFERQPDTVQQDHFDWGFRLSLLWGLDYRFTTTKGIFSNQLLGKNQEYGFDPVMAYLDFYFPHVAQGMDVRIGRYISLPDIEAQLAPNNYTYSHSILYSFDAYTQSGINTTTKLGNHWLFQLGLSGGNDVVPWTKDAKATVNTCLGYTWRDGGSNIYACANSINDGRYAYNNLQAYYLTFYHKFNSHWHQATESWYQYEKHTPNLNNPAATPLLEVGANGAFCKNSTSLTCYAPEWAIVNYFERQFSKHDYMSIRNEYFDDIVGQRTGFKTRYSEHLIGWGHWIGTTVLFRPELRFDHSYDIPAFDNGKKYSQLMLAGDIIFFF